MFGQKPDLPDLPKLNLGDEQQKAIGANIAALPSAEDLVSKANQFSIGEIDKMLTSVIPNYKALASQIGINIESELRGEIPRDVSDAVFRSSAGRALEGGYGGTGASRALAARDLGLTSLALTDRGLKSAESWLAETANIYEPSMTRVSSMFLTPMQQAGFDIEERNAQFQHDWMKEQISSLPDPITTGLWNTSWSIVDSALGAYTGGNFSGMGKVPTGSTSGTNNARASFNG